MNVNVESSDGCRRVIGIVVPAEDSKGEYDSIVKAFVKNAKVSGFRQGRAPLALVEKRYSKSIIQEAKDRLIPRFYNEALKQEKITPVAVVDVQDVEFNRDEGISFKVVVDVAPEFKLPKYKKISLKRESTAVSDEDVETTLQDILKRFSRFEDVTDKPAASGDMIQIDYDAVSDGKPLGEVANDAGDISKGEGFWVPTGESEFVPGLNAALEGSSIGDSLKVDVEFPEDYHVKSVAGLKAVYSVTVKGIRANTPPELTEEFLKQFDVESEDALRDRIRKDLEENAEAKETGRLKEEISKFLIEKTKIEVPQSLVNRETHSLVNDMLERVSRQGASREVIEQHRDEIYESASANALNRVKLSYIINEICSQEDIKVDDEDVEKQLDSIARRYGMPVERIRPELEKRDEGLQNLRSDVLGNKVMEFLLENAKIKD
jgi:trigger factor